MEQVNTTTVSRRLPLARRLSRQGGVLFLAAVLAFCLIPVFSDLFVDAAAAARIVIALGLIGGSLMYLGELADRAAHRRARIRTPDANR